MMEPAILRPPLHVLGIHFTVDLRQASACSLDILASRLE